MCSTNSTFITMFYNVLVWNTMVFGWSSCFLLAHRPTSQQCQCNICTTELLQQSCWGYMSSQTGWCVRWVVPKPWSFRNTSNYSPSDGGSHPRGSVSLLYHLVNYQLPPHIAMAALSHCYVCTQYWVTSQLSLSYCQSKSLHRQC
jgi:hypothetical protein